MSNAYLQIAEQVLLRERRPLSARELLRHAFLGELVPPHLHGATQHKTLHARLSEDIAKHPAQTAFFRTAPGRFFLRALVDDPSIPSAYKRVHRAPRRRKELKRDLVLAIQSAAITEANWSKVSLRHLRHVFAQGRFAYMPWKVLRGSSEFIPVHSFIVVHRDGLALSYQRGRFRPDADPLNLPRSIGFGGVVFASDLELLFDSFHGIVENAVQELVYSIGLPGRLADDARYVGLVEPQFAVTHERGEPFHLDVILSYRCPEEFSPIKTSLSSNDLRWVPLLTPPNDLTAYEETSRKLYEFGWTRNLIG